MKKKQFIFILLFIVIFAFVYRSWFVPGVITGGDFKYYFPSMFGNFSLHPFAWQENQGIGLGGFAGNIAWIPLFPAAITSVYTLFHLPWEILERIYLVLFLGVGSASIFFLYQTLFPKKNLYGLLSIILYLCNTYILMLIGGGQVGVAIAYALVPLVIGAYVRLFQTYYIKKEHIPFFPLTQSLLFATSLILIAFFDPRELVTSFILIALWTLFNMQSIAISGRQKNSHAALGIVLFPVVLFILIHGFWIFSSFFTHIPLQVQLGIAAKAKDVLSFFSFAKFENTLGLLQPNWPENIFGKTNFMQPEFLLMPILAYGALFFIKKKDTNAVSIIFLALVGIFGSFLAKGVQEPFGNVYLWLFTHIPGFQLFRDPTKWYTLIAVSYALLIPYTIEHLGEWLHTWIASLKWRIPNKAQIIHFKNLLILFTVLYSLFLIRPAILGKLSGTFQSKQVPGEYVKLQQYLDTQQQFFRTLWIPSRQRFGYFSPIHPAIHATDFFHTASFSEMTEMTMAQQARIQESAVKYIIVSYDSEQELFIANRKYDPTIREKIIRALNGVPWIQPVPTFSKNIVYQVKNSQDHIISLNPSTKLQEKFENETMYAIHVTKGVKGESIIFSESYDPHWKLVDIQTKQIIQSSQYHLYFMSFPLPRNGSYEVQLVYAPQQITDIFLFFSLVGIAMVFLLWGYVFIKNWLYMRDMVK